MEEKVYPPLPSAPGGSAADYRSNRILFISQDIKNDKQKYNNTFKKYNRLHGFLSTLQGLCSTTSVVLAGGALTTSLTGLGIVVSVPLGAIGGLSGICSAILTVVNRKILRKVDKHRRLLSLTENTELMMSDLVSKSLTDENISEEEFTQILNMVRLYTEKKVDRQPDTGNLKKELEDLLAKRR